MAHRLLSQCPNLAKRAEGQYGKSLSLAPQAINGKSLDKAYLTRSATHILMKLRFQYNAVAPV